MAAALRLSAFARPGLWSRSAAVFQQAARRGFSSSAVPPAPPALTPEQEQIVAATAPVVAQHLNQITATFYPILFDRYPQVKPLFNEAHQGDGAQPRALAAAVLAYVGLRHDPQQARGALATAISKHVSLGVAPEHYPLVGDALLAAIAEVLGDAVTPEIAGAWGALYFELAHLMITIEAAEYERFASLPGGWRGTRKHLIAAKVPESKVITSFHLEPEDGGQVGAHLAGQYIGVRLNIDGKTVYRHYSLSQLSNGRGYRISVKREPEGQASRHLHDRLREGDSLELLPPAGDLTLTPGGQEPLVLISGGVGQTPLLPIARQALAEKDSKRPVVYLHAARDAEHMAFRQELQDLAAEHADRLRVVTVLEEGPGGDYKGRIGLDLLKSLTPAEARCYFVGPTPFMGEMERMLSQLGVPRERMHWESFGPSQPLETASGL